MDVRSDLSSVPQQDNSHEVSPEEEQRFSEWIQKRLSLHQMMEQQVQASIKQTVHFGSEFTKQLEEETERLMARYRRQRLDQLQLRDALRQEVSELRTALADERRLHDASLAQARSQAESEIAQAWRQFETEIGQQRAAARGDRERLLREAYAERDRVIAETRQMSARLAELQRSLSDLLRLASAPEQPPPAARTYALTEAPHAVEPPPSHPDLTRPLADEPALFTIADRSAEENDEDEDQADERADQDNLALTQPLGAVTIETTEPVEAEYTFEYQVLFRDVQSFVVASDLLDQVSRMSGIEGTRLVEYEQNELTIAVTYGGSLPLAALLKDELSAVARLVDQRGEQVHLVYHAAA